MAVLVRLGTGLAMVSVVGFGYVAGHEWRYSSTASRTRSRCRRLFAPTYVAMRKA